MRNAEEQHPDESNIRNEPRANHENTEKNKHYQLLQETERFWKEVNC